MVMEAEEKPPQGCCAPPCEDAESQTARKQRKHCLNHKQFCSLPRLSIIGAILSTWSPIELDWVHEDLDEAVPRVS